ncbi:acetyl-CoA sensor PanZ family protein [Reinekea marinisedimentorum]|uniref:Acetyltransferase (GNAT) family protein n=1 Tax=Reinekea marinisedimentorum TaxID=230495 RepID=A0A4R3IAT0_9GAMM|nr:acetyl-CoA sensor PanZ family protein [Reinekea marinisedimentorum]TCS43084.1 acetyltransferase (GNAT) family protein [Reinekea marinisedimentorum]
MPVILCQQSSSSDSLNNSLQEIVRDLPKKNPATKAVQRWPNSEKPVELWTAVFNERIVGFAFVSGCRLKAVAVHPITRNRGVGRRILSLLIENRPDLKLTKGEDNPWIVDCYHKLLSKKG